MTTIGSPKAKGGGSSRKKWALTVQTVQPPVRLSSDWLWTSLLTARTIAAASESVPYLKGVFGTVVILLETVETVKKNREDLRELCGNVMEILNIIREQLSFHEDTVPVKFKSLCGDLEECLHSVLNAVKESQRSSEGLGGRLREIMRTRRTADEITGYQRKIRELHSNFLLTVAMDTNFQVHKVLTVMSPVDATPPTLKSITNNCPLPSRIFHGRQIVLDRMHSYFLQDFGKQKIFLLHGLGGAGKTQIALKFIAKYSSRFSDIFLIDCSTSETIDTGFKTIATTKNAGTTAQAGEKWLTGEPRGWLIVFDNADDPKVNLNKFLPHCDHGSIIITSRNPGLRVYAGEHSLVSDMEEPDAVELLLASSVQEVTPSSKELATEIVLCYLPLAIIQAGAFIAKSGSLNSYLALYAQNQARLLSEKPAQSHDDYAWTVYTTWQMSFEKLSQAAATVLQLFSLLHHQGISEQIFRNAVKYKGCLACPTLQELHEPAKFLSQFLGPTGIWEPLSFIDVTNELQAYSLINFTVETNMFSIHPLVHSWTRSTLSDVQVSQYWMGAILGMFIASIEWSEREAIALWLEPHIESLLQGRVDVAPDFNIEYAQIYEYAGRLKKAEELEVAVIEKQKQVLGEEHPDTLNLLRRLGATYHKSFQFDKSEGLFIAVMEKQKKIFGLDHPDTLLTMGHLAATYIELGRFEEAEELTVIVLEKENIIHGEDTLRHSVTMGNLGWIYHNLGRLKEAEQLQAVAVAKLKNIVGHEHPHTLWIMGNLASTYRNLGQYEKAEELEVFVVEKQRKILGEGHEYTLWTMGNLALTYRAQGHLEMALEVQVAVLEKRLRTLGGEHPETVRAIKDLAATRTALVEVNETQNDVPAN
ncbi:hypothetical protein C8J57DRAFT_1721026 [Mycena rebaudengoi]|nr:hypothetical protein C8J57DRAFT_1721026 [Mycena rebaudengoi]